MSTAQASTPGLLTAEEFAERPDPGYPEELVRGRIVRLPQPKPRQGEICGRAVRILGNWADDHDLGRVLYRADGTTRLLGPDEELPALDLLGDFHLGVGRFFE
jgi:Uma2 family endonuclease